MLRPRIVFGGRGQLTPYADWDDILRSAKHRRAIFPRITVAPKTLLEDVRRRLLRA